MQSNPNYATFSIALDQLGTFAGNSASFSVVASQGGSLSASSASPISVTASPWTVARADDVLEAQLGEAAFCDITYYGATSWPYTISNSAGSAVFSAAGSGSHAYAMWSGGSSPSDTYTAQVTFQPGSQVRSWNTFLGKGAPEFMGLIAAVETDNPVEMSTYDHWLGQQVAPCYPNANYVWILLHTAANVNQGEGSWPSDTLQRKIYQYFATTVRDFYYYGHASPIEFDFGALHFFALTLPANKPAFQSGDIDVGSVTQNLGHLFNIVVLDGCNTAGPDPVTSNGNPGPVDFSWFNAFDISVNGSIVAYDGYTEAFDQHGLWGSGPSPWQSWDYLLWGSLGGVFQTPLSSAVLTAIERFTPGNAPWEPTDYINGNSRLQYYDIQYNFLGGYNGT